ncbi:class I SAM-dependent methyltransferase [Bacillus sp. 165]|uniref:class I SAM-dependent methyltransferase n=1 Tax=Bacillus sp. 165 TaxID=1529117 RepID=UPI001AD9DB7B|nr:class I SAM-dependent methyltransferase [Bacillus sp. 165]MBO9129279.1 methyltransferase domain-containing protein [Bacillus sp. 165]
MQLSFDNQTFPYDETNLGYTELQPQFRVDLRKYNEKEINKFVTLDIIRDWAGLQWKDIGKPYEVKVNSKERVDWEQKHKQEMDVKTSWTYFNKAFHQWFMKDVPAELQDGKKELFQHFKHFEVKEVKTTLGDMLRLNLWNYAHRIEDGIWDPRGKRTLFAGLDVTKPRILFLGAAEGYEAMQLSAMYPGGEAVLVDYDEYCRDTRFAEFPEHYPFLGSNANTGSDRVWYKDEMNLQYIVEDIRKLPFGAEFDIVISVGLLEHFPDEYKPEVMEWHRKFLKPGGYAILTTPRSQWKSKLYYTVMADIMNHTYRELMTIQQMGLYVYENGFNILRHGYIKVHNAIVAQVK